MRLHSLAVLLCVAGSLAACTPTYNWREARFDGTSVVALLPCKPDEGSRNVALAGRPLQMTMKGCEADGLTFAAAWVDAGDGAHLAETLGAWKAATLANARATVGSEAPFLPGGGVALQGSSRLSANGRLADGAPVELRAAWFAKGTHVYQALVIGPHVDADVADTFFAGLRLP